MSFYRVGNSSIVSELEASFGVSGTVPSCIVVSVGGGGLLLGVMEGVMQHKAWNGVPILAMETVGADCLNKSIKAGRSVRLEKISRLLCLPVLEVENKPERRESVLPVWLKISTGDRVFGK